MGRTTYQIEVIAEVPGQTRTERQRCDLFDWEAHYEWAPGEGKKPGLWNERRRHVVPGSGLLGQFAAFQKDAKPFFV